MSEESKSNSFASVGIVLYIVGFMLAIIAFGNLPDPNASDNSILNSIAFSITYAIFSVGAFICGSIFLKK